MIEITRRSALAVGLGILAAPGVGRAGTTVRIGYQKYGTLVILKETGRLEPALAALGCAVSWKEFPGGPQLLEAMAADAIDFGITGEAPPIIAQAAGARMTYVGVEPAAPRGEAIIVPNGSPITAVAGLRGRKVVLNKGSNVHFLLVRALEAAGVGYREITTVFLPPADARAAFESGQVDAWAIWDPYLAAAQAATGARTLVDATGLAPNRQFYLAEPSFAAANRPVLDRLLATIGQTDAWAAAHQAEVVPLLARAAGLPLPVVTTALARLEYGVQPMTADVVAGQQAIADAFHAMRLIPAPLVVGEAVWRG